MPAIKLSAQCSTGVTANFTFSGDNQCSNGSVSFNNSSTGSGLSFEWNFGNPSSGANNTSTLQNPTHHFVSNGSGSESFAVTLISTNGSGCKDTIVKTLSMKQTPGATLDDPINNFRNCDGTIYNIQVFDLTPTIGSSYRIVWGDGSPDFTNSSFPPGGTTHTYATDQIYNLLYIVSGTNGCTDTNRVTVANITNPSIGAANPGGTTGCGPLDICFPLNNFSANHASTIYTIDFGDGTAIDTIQHPPPNQLCHTYVKTSCGNGTNNAYTFSINAINFCDVSVATITPIKVYLKPVAKFSNPPAACVNSNVNFTNLTVPGFFGNGCSQFTTLEWNFGDGTIVNTNSITDMQHVYTATGTYTVSLKASNSCGDSIFSQNICIEDTPVPDFLLDKDTACVSFEVRTKNLSQSGIFCNVDYFWSVSLAANNCNQTTFVTNFVQGTSSTSFEPIIEFVDPAVYQVQLQVSNSCGTFSKTLPVVAQGPPQTSISTPLNSCTGQAITPTASVGSCMSPITSYQWTFAGGSPASSNQEIPGSVSYTTAGTFNMSFSATNVCGTSSSNASIVVNSAPPLLHPQISGPVCPGGDVQLSCDSIAGASFTWTGPSGFFTNQQNPLITGVSTAHEGLYTVSAITGNCQGPSDTVRLTLLNTPLVDAGADKDFCENASAQNFNPVSANGGTWSGTGINAAGNFNPQLAGVGAHAINYQFTDPATGCQSSDVLVATVHAKPVPDAGPDLNLCLQPNPVILNGSPAGGFWSGAGVTNPTGEFIAPGTGNFNLVYTYTDGFACVGTDTLMIAVVNASSVDAGNDTTACESGTPIQLTGTPAGGTWTGSGISPTGNYNPAGSGFFDVVYTIGSGTCITTDTLVIEVLAKPVVNAGVDFSSCTNGNPVNLTGSPAGGSWAGTGITNISGLFDPIVAGSGTHTLTYTAIDALTGCSASDDLLATVQASPVVNAGVDTTLCNQPFPVQLSASPGGGTWSGSNVSPTGVFTPNSSGSFVLTYSLSSTPPCAASDTRTITVVDPAVADVGPDQSLCFSNTPMQLVATPAGGSWSGSQVSSNGLLDLSISGVYQLEYRFGAGNCLTIDTLDLIIHDLPAISIDPGLSFCPYDPAHTFNANPSGGTWLGIAVTSGGQFDPSQALADDLGHYLRYQFTDIATGCTNSDSLETIVHTKAISQFTSDPVACSQQTNNFPNIGNNAVSHVWDYGDGSGSFSSFDGQHSYANPGFYPITLISTSSFGCSDTSSQIIEIREAPNPTYLMSVNSGCGPLIVDFINQSTGIGSLDYFWDFGNGQNSLLAQPGSMTYPAGVLNDTVYPIRLDVTNFCGTISFTDSVRVKPSPKAVFGTLFNEGCTPFNAEFANNSYGQPSAYQWDFGNGQSSTDSSALLTHIFQTGADDTTFSVRLIVSNNCGTDTAFHQIHVLPKSVNSFFNTDLTQGCAPFTVQFTSFSSGAQFHNWDLGDGNFSSAASLSHVYTTPGTYQVELIVNDACSIDTSYASITVHPQANIDFSFNPTALCVGQAFNFTNLSVGVTNLQWDFGDGSTSSLSDPSYSYTASGNYNVTLSGTSTLHQCLASISKVITVSATPQADFFFPVLDNCVPETINFTNTSSNFSFVLWNFGDGNFSSAANPSHTYVKDSTYEITLLVQNTLGCSDSIKQSLIIHPLPTADFNITSNDTCTLPASSQFTNLSIGANSYHWYFGDGNESFLTNPDHTYLSSGNYTVSLVAANLFGCIDSISKPFNLFTPPIADLLPIKTSLCQREDFQLVSISSQADSVVWILGDGNRLNGSNLFHHYDSVGTYQISLIAYGAGGCSDTAYHSQLINVLETPVAQFDYLNIENEGVNDGSIQFMNQSIFADSFIWHLDNQFFSDEIHPLYRYDFPGNLLITLTAINDNGCQDTIIQTIIIDFFKGLHIPNAMNPGHPVFDVANFAPKGVGLSDYHIGIYDDWGNLIWESSDLDEDGRPTGYWDGTFLGEPAQQDAYVWKVEATYRTSEVWEGKRYPNGKIKRSGTVSLIR